MYSNYFCVPGSKFRYSLFFFVFSVVFISGNAYTQPRMLTYQEAITIAVGKNITIKQQRNQLALSQAEKQHGVADFLPKVSAGGEGYRTDGRQWSNEEGDMVNTTIDRVDYNLSANITVFNGFRNVYRLRQSDALYQAQEKKVERTVQDVIFQVSQSFLQVLLDKELLGIAQKDTTVQQQLYARITDDVKLGTRTQTDLLSQAAQLRSSEVKVINLQSQLLTDKLGLAKLLFMKPGEAFEVLPPKWEIDSLLTKDYQIDSLLAEATENRPDMAQLKAQERAAREDVKISRAGYWPSLSAFYNYGSFFNSDYRRFNTADSTYIPISFNEQMLHENYSHVYGFSLSIPLFSRLDNRTQVVESRIAYENTDLAYKDFERQLYLDIQREYQHYLSYKESYLAKKIRAEATRQAYEKQYELYTMGKGDIVSLSLESQQNIQAQSEKVQAEYTLYFQQIVLQYYTGTLGN